MISILAGGLGTVPQKPGKETEDQRKNREDSDHNTDKISSNA